jgi:hypothetical protein
MGKSRNKPRRIDYSKQHQGMDQSGIGERSGASEQRSLCPVANVDSGGAVAVSGSVPDTVVSSERGDGLPERECVVRRFDTRSIRVSRGTPPQIRRSFDAKEINEIVNHPDIFPHVTVPGVEFIDVGPQLEDPRNVLLMTEGGGIFCLWQDFGIYECHIHFLKPFRGVNAILAIEEASKWMFTHTDCLTLWARVPENEPNVEACAANVGMSREFFRPAVWPTANGPVGMSFWELKYEDWVKQTPSLVKVGTDFLTKLGFELREEVINRRAGAAVEMIYGGEPEKASVLYSRWARFAGLPGLAFVARKPLVMQYENIVLQFLPEERDFKIIRRVV